MTKLIPGAALIYERVNGTVYARYRDPPHNTIPRWVIGGTADSLAMENIFSFSEWQEMIQLAKKHQTLKNELDKLKMIYYICRESK
jgi:hypothetical protein